MGHPAAVQELKARLTGARAVAVLTGAGISADSGVPTFRGADGLWRTYRAEDLATPEAFARDPRLVWEWYNWRRELIATKSPNAAHYALVDLERRVERFWLITQNVDGLHPAAGSQKLSEIHGNIWKVRCTQCGHVGTNRAVPIPIPPRCPTCNGLLRPHIVWFGESLDPADLERSLAAVRSCEVLLIIGTSGGSCTRQRPSLRLPKRPAPSSQKSISTLPRTRRAWTSRSRAVRPRSCPNYCRGTACCAPT